ncbi:MAG TPA: glucoamylase family protein [Terriglobia bacterium]|nr:glucoamylase family protein [Terriglobia bacterium]
MTWMSDESPRDFLKTPAAGNIDADVGELSEAQQPESFSSESQAAWLRALGARQARNWIVVAPKKCPKLLKVRWRKAAETLQFAVRRLCGPASGKLQPAEEQRWILENARLLRGISKEVGQALKSFPKLPCARSAIEQPHELPRTYQIATNFLQAAGCAFKEEAFGEYLAGVQRVVVLEMRELWALKPLLQLVLLEELGRGAESVLDSSGRNDGKENYSPETLPFSASKTIASLHAISRMEWKDFFEANSSVDHILREDPSGAYPKMDFESRQLYRDAIADLAPHTKLNEAGIARQAVLGARSAQRRKRGPSLRAIERRSNVGYYLLDAGSATLKESIGYHPPLKKKIREIILEWPEVYYTVGVELTTLLMVYLLLRHLGTIIPLVPGLLLLIPASQAAVGLMNHLTTYLLRPRQLPKLDFSAGIPTEFLTMVVVPSLLLNEKEVRHIVESLEVRYLGNRDPNLHFALLTDSPDASQPHDQHDELVGLCSSMIEQLNARYAREQQGAFFHFHRHRVYNPQENTWMGWERKRGKLLDLNQLLRNGVDNFPVKVGDLSILPRVRYVITLDSDTRLPGDTAHRLVGALAHPLNCAVIDRETNTVVEGYGILQPRVGISIESARQSRLASIYSGETGCDIYTRAVSDVYQDLFGEGSFAGKGIYEVDSFQQVLGNRFPSNALLSHDLIEGAYARAGLVSDIEVIDDYPSHFSAYCRRMHRWVRGDWQILRWLLPRVPDFFGSLVSNPLTLLSRWKIFDNLRRSLIELNLFLLLLAGWFFFPGGPLYWTLITLALLLMPTYVQLIFSLLRISEVQSSKGFFKERANDFFTGHLQVFVMLAFLPHRAFVMLDAIVRTLARLTITHKNLLEWETAAEAEMGARKKTAVEVYLAFTPWFALAAGLGLAFFRPAGLLAAAPVLGLWLLAGTFTKWVNRSPHRRENRLNPQDNIFLRRAALHTWRYFLEFSNQEMNWLVPDRVQEMPSAVVGNLSPTNLGFLLNAPLAAHRLGYLTLAEFVEHTEKTIRSAKRLPRFKGHFFNWYDVHTLKPLSPLFISTVDSGNLAACLWTLKQACLGLLKEPLVAKESGQGLRDHIGLMQQLLKEKLPSVEVVSAMQKLAADVKSLGEEPLGWIQSLPRLHDQVCEIVAALRVSDAEQGNELRAPMDELKWWASETLVRIESLRGTVQVFLPWLLPEYRRLQVERPLDRINLNALPSLVADLEKELDALLPLDGHAGAAGGVQSLRSRLEACVQKATELSGRLQRLAEEAEELLHAMDFRFLYDSRRKLLSIGYDVSAQRREQACYDLLASEARIATFIAIAKGDIKREAWFHLGRSRTLEQGEAVLVSWSGTMFEYLMPLLWMRAYSGTLLDQSMCSAVVCQQRYTRKKGIPWGLSEAAFSARDHKGIYQYRAFGLPNLARDPNASDDTVIAPYASFLALLVDAPPAASNLKAMWEKGWSGRFGFYESADYSTDGITGSANGELVRCWMAHHQGMSLLAVCNLLTESSLQRWFHQEPQVMATELLLHEKVSLAEPEETSPAFRPQSSSPRLVDGKPAGGGPVEQLPGSGKSPQTTRLIAEVPPGTSLGPPVSDGEATPPQA